MLCFESVLLGGGNFSLRFKQNPPSRLLPGATPTDKTATAIKILMVIFERAFQNHQYYQGPSAKTKIGMLSFETVFLGGVNSSLCFKQNPPSRLLPGATPTDKTAPEIKIPPVIFERVFQRHQKVVLTLGKYNYV